MATYTGTVQHNDLEGGFLELRTDDGEVYRLSGAEAKPGDRVKVEGKVASGGFGIHMSGPSLEVSRLEKL